jgi:hypothetical protein
MKDDVERDRPVPVAKLRRDIYVRLRIANAKDRGVHLSADDVANLVKMDDAISAAADNLIDASGYDVREAASSGRLVKVST